MTNTNNTPAAAAAAIAMLEADLQKFEALKAAQYETAPADWNKYGRNVDALKAHLAIVKANI